MMEIWVCDGDMGARQSYDRGHAQYVIYYANVFMKGLAA